MSAELLVEIATSRSELQTIARQAGAGSSRALCADAREGLILLRAVALNLDALLARLEESERPAEWSGNSTSSAGSGTTGLHGV